MAISDEQRMLADDQLRKLQQEVDFDTKDYPVEFIVHKFKTKEFVIPFYQRQFIWKPQHQSSFVESILLGLPTPFMFFSENEDDKAIEIIDGAQRTQTLVNFLDDKLKLKGLKKLNMLNGFKFKDLSLGQQNKFKNRALRIIILSEKTTVEVRQDIFNRINTAGIKANYSEVRRGAFEGEFMKFLYDCSENSLFKSLCPISENLQRRYEGIELVLRFFAYLHNYKSFTHRVDMFLDQYIEDVKDNYSEVEMKDEFVGMLNFVQKNFPLGFRKAENSNTTPRVRFEAISVGVALALQSKPDLKIENVDWLNSDDFSYHTTTHASNTQNRVFGRIEFVRDKLLGV